MKNYEKFLAYWSLIVSSILLIVALFFFPQPLSFFLFALFLPITLYFWLKLSLAQENNPYRWSVKILLLLLIVGVLGLFAFQLVKEETKLSSQTKPSSQQEQSLDILGEKNFENNPVVKEENLLPTLEEIKKELFQIKAEQRALRELLEISGSAQNVVEILNRILEASGSALP